MSAFRDIVDLDVRLVGSYVSSAEISVTSLLSKLLLDEPCHLCVSGYIPNTRSSMKLISATP